MKPQPCNPATLKEMLDAVEAWPEGHFFGRSEARAFVRWYYSLPAPMVIHERMVRNPVTGEYERGEP